jgi:hypothetical protein
MQSIILTLTSEAFFQPVILDAPEHEDDRGDDGEDEGVGEVSVERQLDDVPTQTESSGVNVTKLVSFVTDAVAK